MPPSPSVDPIARCLPEELTIYAVGDLASQCRAWLDQDDAAAAPPADLILQAGAVAQVDGAGVQLLIALSNSLAERGRRLDLQGPTPLLRQALARLGAQALLAPAAEGEAIR
ncbi:MAG: STAS domain-containing protein [Burkholderiaceae bacterium]|nr:STAS domain-containing protein [Burkholderiaceae bacterium]